MKKAIRIALSLVMVLALLLPIAVSASDEINVTIDGSAVAFPDAPPVVIDGRTLVPVRAVLERLGYHVDWSRPIITVTGDGCCCTIELILEIDSADFTVHGLTHTLDVPAQTIGGSTKLPIRAVLESLGYGVEWDRVTQTVLITTADDSEIYLFTREELNIAAASLGTSDLFDRFNNRQINNLSLADMALLLGVSPIEIFVAAEHAAGFPLTVEEAWDDIEYVAFIFGVDTDYVFAMSLREIAHREPLVDADWDLDFDWDMDFDFDFDFDFDDLNILDFLDEDFIMEILMEAMGGLREELAMYAERYGLPTDFFDDFTDEELLAMSLADTAAILGIEPMDFLMTNVIEFGEGIITPEELLEELEELMEMLGMTVDELLETPMIELLPMIVDFVVEMLSDLAAWF